MTSRTEALICTSAPLHIYNRGVNGEPIFRDDHDYSVWMDLKSRALPRYEVNLLSYSLMPNHFHDNLIQFKAYEVSRFVHDFCWKYAKFYNKKYKRFGPVFAGRFVPKIIPDDAGLLRLSHYIHMNPVTAHLCSTPAVWPYSSCASYLGSRNNGLAKTEMILQLVGGVSEYKRFLQDYDPQDPLSIYRFIPNSGRVV